MAKRQERPYTEDQFRMDYESGLTLTEIADKWIVGRKKAQKDLRFFGITPRRAISRGQSKDRNNHWRGGEWRDSKTTYKWIYRPDHPHSNRSGHVAEHIVIALEAAGLDRLPRGFCVHHVNLDKTDNSPANLHICTLRQHNMLHRSLERLAIDLLFKQGIVEFVPSIGYKEVSCG